MFNQFFNDDIHFILILHFIPFKENNFFLIPLIFLIRNFLIQKDFEQLVSNFQNFDLILIRYNYYNHLTIFPTLLDTIYFFFFIYLFINFITVVQLEILDDNFFMFFEVIHRTIIIQVNFYTFLCIYLLNLIFVGNEEFFIYLNDFTYHVIIKDF